MVQSILQAEQRVFGLINTGYTRPWLDRLAHTLSSSTLWFCVGIAAASLALILHRQRAVRLVVFLALTVALTDFTCAYVIKPWVHRDRPCYHHGEVRQVGGCGGEFGFPSNHAANGMAIALILLLGVSARLGWTVFLTTLAVGASRVYLGMHLPGDVLGGFLIGAAFGVAAAQLEKRLKTPAFMSRFAPLSTEEK